ncbi:MAG: right-handed parallel beta-helix repeat-containing protein [Kiritimatiellaeota bacterium]|nr:right-handed parallel beta-helix repeat-containing protein [Kiritimatiellota bacterium]
MIPRKFPFTKVCVASLLIVIAAHAAAEIFVTPEGAAGDGSRTRPFTSLEQAREAVRALKKSGALPAGGVTVWLQPGVYRRAQTLDLTADDSGTAAAPVVWRAAKQGTAELHAGTFIKPENFQPVTDTAILSRLDPAARGHMLQLKLTPLGLKHTDPFPAEFHDGGGVLHLFCGGQWMPLARWPNSGDVTMAQVLDRGDWSKGAARHGGAFVYREDRPARWRVESGVWLEGYWRVPWEPRALRVKSIDTTKRTITFAEPLGGGIGSKYAKAPALGDGKEPWCAINLLEEIDLPGEWCVDFPTQTLYFWPPCEQWPAAQIFVGDFELPLVTLKEAAHVGLLGLTFEGGLGNGVEISGGASNVIAGCTFRNLGGSGVLVRGGVAHTVRSSDFHGLGRGGIYLAGGDRKTLTPARHVAENNNLWALGIRQKTYAVAIHLGAFGNGDAVGCRVAHNFMHDLPHAAVLYGGNDNVLEFNEVAHVALTSGDVGTFYTWHDWTSQGNVVRYNFVHDSPRANAFYMDDGDSGDVIEGNVVARCHYGPFIGGGHLNVVRNNLIIETDRGLHFDNRGVSRGYATDKGLRDKLHTLPVTQPPWSTRYPALPKILALDLGLPHGNLIERNVTVACPKPLDFSGKKTDFADNTIRDNLDLGTEDARFVNAAQLDYRLQPDSPVFKKLPAFQPISFEKIGLQCDEFRATLPPRTAAATSGKGAVFDSAIDIEQSNRTSPKKK